MKRSGHVMLSVLAALTIQARTPKLLAATLSLDHIHLAVSDPEMATEWYIKYMGGTKVEGSNQARFGPMSIMFQRASNAQPSVGSVFDFIGFSFPDLDAKMAELQAAHVKVVTPVRLIPGMFKLGYIEDPWGVKIEVVQDLEALGFHHFHLRAIDPDELTNWLLDSFGGERGKIAGRLDALRYGKVWVVIQKPVASEAPVPAPSAGRAIDHVGWRVANLDATSVELKDKGVKFTTEPQAVAAVKTAFVEAPNGLRIELLQR